MTQIDSNLTPARVSLANSEDNSSPQELRRQAIINWNARHKAAGFARVKAESARESRLRYRSDREALGLEVRGYSRHNHDPQMSYESADDYKKRMHRDRQRAYRNRVNRDSKTVRVYTDLSEMTPEELSSHKKMLARERKRKERQSKKAVGHYNSKSDLTPAGLSALEETIKSLPE